MACAKAYPAVLLALCGLAEVTRTARAAPASSEPGEERRPPLGRSEIALLGDVGQDPVLFERIRSLFPPQTAVVLRDDDRIDQQALLQPQRADTVYIWIRVTERTRARVYLALGDDGGRTRYLFREIRLDTGLDEVGGETLAEVAHSSAQALWQREQQTSRPALLAALQRESEPAGITSAPPPAPRRPEPIQKEPDVALKSDARSETAHERPSTSPVRLALGVSDSTHASGVEGWLQEPGAFLGAEYGGRLSLRAAVRYLVPSAFDRSPVRVHLSGASGELRAGWLSNDASRFRFRIEAGLGVLWGHAWASLASDEPMAHVLPERDFRRVYSLAAAAVDFPLGPAWVTLGADLRVPLQTTSYEVAGQSGASLSSSLSPGGSIEVGFGFDPILR